MNPQIIYAIAKKDLIDVVKNKSTLMALLTPIIMAIVFLAVSNLLNNSTDIVRSLHFYDPGNSGLVTAVNAQFDYNLVLTSATSAAEVRDAVARKEVIFGLVVPADYVDQLKVDGPAEVEFYYDQSKTDATTAGRVTQGIERFALQTAAMTVPGEITVEALNAAPVPTLRDLNVQNVYSLFAIVTSVISCSLGIMPNLLVEEKEKKTLRSLIVSPATFGEIVVAKLLVGLLYTGLISLLVILINLPPVDSLPLVVVGVLFSGVFFNLIGLLIGVISPQMTSANVYSAVAFFLAFFPMLLLLMPFLDTSQGLVAVILHAIPSFYFGDLFRMAMQESPDMSQVGFRLVICGALIALTGLLSTWALRRQRV